MKASGTEGYGETADALVKQYESLSFTDVHRDTLHLIPPTPSRVLDVGAGTGRDAAALAALGHTVVAVEPTPELRAHGQRLHREAAITWIDDSLPDLNKVHARGERFDLVMLTAVWMHLDSGQCERAMAGIAGLLQPGGLSGAPGRGDDGPAARQPFTGKGQAKTARGAYDQDNR